MLEVMTAVSGMRCTTALVRPCQPVYTGGVVDGHVPIYYTAMKVEPGTHRPKRWQWTDVMDGGPSKPQVEDQG
jgi:hypothetical protein